MGWSMEDMNETGYKQTSLLAARLARNPIAAVYSSPLQRAVSTADILAEPHRLEARVLQDIIEIKLGKWEGHNLSEVKQLWPDLFEKWRSDPSAVTMPEGESLDQVAHRSFSALQRIIEENSGKTILVVSHDINIRLIVINILGCPNYIFRRLRTDNASLTVIKEDGLHYRLITLNDTAHLENM